MSLLPQVQKLAVTVELLMGDIPQRQTFRKPELRRPLAPYFQLTQSESTDRHTGGGDRSGTPN